MCATQAQPAGSKPQLVRPGLASLAAGRTVGITVPSLGHLGKAIEHMRKALDIQMSLYNTNTPKVLAAMADLALLLWKEDN